jgi:hypothetical protein
MGLQKHAPNAAHHAMNTDLNALAERYDSIPAVERVALIAQFLGGQLALVDGWSPAEVMHAVSANIEAGNREAATQALIGDRF